MGEVVAGVKHVSDIIGEIRTASEEQRDGIEQVNHAIGQMDRVMQQNAALVEQAAAAVQAMQDQASGLARMRAQTATRKSFDGYPTRFITSINFASVIGFVRCISKPALREARRSSSWTRPETAIR
jgi:hypothetical protein